MQYSGLAGTKQSLSLAREQELLESQESDCGQVGGWRSWRYLGLLVSVTMTLSSPHRRAATSEWEKEAPHLSPVWPKHNHSGF